MRGALLALLLAPLFAGCGAISYYSQAVGGHLELMHRATPIEARLQSADTPDALKVKLEAVLRMREFASRELGLPDNGSYRSYADLERRFVVWNVFAAPEFSLKPVNSCFLFVGCVSYRGYFSEAAAEAQRESLKAQGYDTYVGGVPAYSTLGWFNDPVLNTFIHYPPAELARLIFHELAHQTVYVRNDTRFNESFAVAVEEAGAARWLARSGDPKERAAYERLQGIKRDFLGLMLRHRAKLEAHYELDLPLAEKRAGKQLLYADLTREYGEFKIAQGGFAGYDRWFAAGPNNALLASVALYTDLVPAFRALLAREGGDLPRFYAVVKGLARMSEEERAKALDALAGR